VFLDVPDAVSAQRLSGRDLDRFEAAGADFHDRVLAGFRAMAAEDPARWVTVDAVGTVDDVAAAVRAALAGQERR
jgi:dTMP kinase